MTIFSKTCRARKSLWSIFELFHSIDPYLIPSSRASNFVSKCLFSQKRFAPKSHFKALLNHFLKVTFTKFILHTSMYCNFEPSRLEFSLRAPFFSKHFAPKSHFEASQKLFTSMKVEFQTFHLQIQPQGVYFFKNFLADTFFCGHQPNCGFGGMSAPFNQIQKKWMTVIQTSILDVF